MRLLVSLCARTESAPEALLVYDTASAAIEPIPLPGDVHGVFGIAVGEGVAYCAADMGRPTPGEPERSELLALDLDTMDIRWRYPFRIGLDVHSLLTSDDGLYAVSTGSDELLVMGLADDGRIATEEVLWRVDRTTQRADRHHLNDVRSVGDDLLVSGFGPRPGPAAWADAREGSVWSIPAGRQILGPIYHPHSICGLLDGELAVCESPRSRVVTSTGRISALLPGYARGMCLDAERLFVGTSRDRRPSEPRSILPHDPPAQTPPWVCSVSRLDARTLRLEDVVDLAPYGREVYDIVPLPQ